MAQDPRALLQKADKAASSAGGGFSFFGGRSDKLEGAADMYIQAANAFRMQKMDREAGQTFEKAADLQTNKLNEPDDAANTMTDAFKSYRKVSPEDAARCLQKAINHYCSKGNFRRAATHQQNLAEVYEIEIGDPKRAAEAYETAAGWFETDNAEALANKLYLKVGDLAGLDGDYQKAIANFERVAKASVNNNLMRYSLKDYFQKDLVGTSRALDTYRELDPGFTQTREHQLLVDLAEAIESGDAEKFTDCLFMYDKMSKLDKWKTTILLRVKSTIEEKGEDFS